MPIIQFFESEITFRDTTILFSDGIMSIYILQNNDKYQYLSLTRISSYITMKVALNIIYSLDTPVSSTNKTDRHVVTEILLKMALSTIIHQYHIICMHHIYDNQFHCNIILLIQIFLDNFCNFTFQRSANDQHIMQFLPSFEVQYKFRFVNPRAIIFLMVCPRYHTVLWVDES